MASPCFDKACELLALRPHFRAELERKLGRRGYAAEAVEAALARLEELGYVDDEGCARALAEGPLSRRGYGPLRMRAELVRRGASEGVAEEAVAAAFVDGDEAAARQAAERWLSRRRAADGAGAALGRHLDRKGFSSSTVLRLVRELGRDGDG